MVADMDTGQSATGANRTIFRMAWIGASETPNSCGPRFNTLSEALDVIKDFNDERKARRLQPCKYILELARRTHQKLNLGPYEEAALFEVDLDTLAWRLVRGKTTVSHAVGPGAALDTQRR